MHTEGGIFCSSVEVYFGAKDTALPVSVQIRHMENGFPTQRILPFGEKTLSPASVNTSADASVATNSALSASSSTYLSSVSTDKYPYSPSLSSTYFPIIAISTLFLVFKTK